MIFRLAFRSLATRPIRTAVLACGFGFGIAVMAALLGVGDVILEQAHSPALSGGGDMVILGRFGTVESARFVMTGVLGAPDVAKQIAVASPSKRATVYLMSSRGPIAVAATGLIPSRESAIANRTTTDPAWADTVADRTWAAPSPGAALTAMDRFHPIPDLPEFSASWAEWLYFNGHTADGRLRFYLTFLAGPKAATAGRRVAGVRLQLERDGQSTNYATGGEIDEARLLAGAPDLDIAGNACDPMGRAIGSRWRCPGAAGDLSLDATPGRSLPRRRFAARAGGSMSYTAPVLSGTFRGNLIVGGHVAIDSAGYHDHNGARNGALAGGQVAHDDISIIYGRVRSAGRRRLERVPGFRRTGPERAARFSTAVSIRENSAPIAAACRAAPSSPPRPGDRHQPAFNVGAIRALAMAMTQAPVRRWISAAAGEYTVSTRRRSRAELQQPWSSRDVSPALN